MYHDSKSKTQSEQSKANTSTPNKSHMQTGIKMPVQTKSLFSPSFNQDRSEENSSPNHVFRPAQLSPLTYSPLQMQPMPKQERKEIRPLPFKMNENQEKLAPISAKPNNTGIPTPMKSHFEVLSGFSFDDVRVHYNSDKPAQLQALAYTQGNQVYIGPGQEEHLGHELGHVVQQKQERVQPTIQLQGVYVNDDAILEREADGFSRSQSGQGVIQRYVSVLKNGLTNDFVENTSIDYAVKRANTPVELFKNSNFSELVEENSLYFVAHGKPGQAGDIPTSDLTTRLKDQDRGLKAAIKEIVFTSCSAGADENVLGSSVVDKVFDEVNSLGFNKKIPVRGATGLSIKSDATGNEFFVVDKDKKTPLGRNARQLQNFDEVDFMLKLKLNEENILDHIIQNLESVGFTDPILKQNINNAISVMKLPDISSFLPQDHSEEPLVTERINALVELLYNNGFSINSFIKNVLAGLALSITEKKAEFIAILTAPFFISFTNDLALFDMLKLTNPMKVRE